jgi:hypothetical protein
MTFLDDLENWYTNRQETLEAQGLNLSYHRDDRAASVNIERPGCVGEVLVYLSGEVELGATTRPGGRERDDFLLLEHHEVAVSTDLFSLADRVAAVVQDAPA